MRDGLNAGIDSSKMANCVRKFAVSPWLLLTRIRHSGYKRERKRLSLSAELPDGERGSGVQSPKLAVSMTLEHSFSNFTHLGSTLYLPSVRQAAGVGIVWREYLEEERGLSLARSLDPPSPFPGADSLLFS